MEPMIPANHEAASRVKTAAESATTWREVQTELQTLTDEALIWVGLKTAGEAFAAIATGQAVKPATKRTLKALNQETEDRTAMRTRQW